MAGISLVAKSLTLVIAQPQQLDTSFDPTVSNGWKTILDNVNLCIKPNSLTAIMGPSGSGKTSLLNVCSGRMSGVSLQPIDTDLRRAGILGQKRAEGTTGLSGDILFNGKSGLLPLATKFVGYVMQHDHLPLEFLTVEETIRFVAKLRLKQLDSATQSRRVETLIKDLGLTKCRDTKIGGRMIKGVSGGELKRVSLAIELLSDPKLIFCDEPTSGLDTSLAHDVIRVLAKLAKSGRTIVCTIHQPRSQLFTMFSDLVLLSQGKIVYEGPLDKASPYFSGIGYSCPTQFNPADYFLDILTVGAEKKKKRSTSKKGSKILLSRLSRSLVKSDSSFMVVGGGGAIGAVGGISNVTAEVTPADRQGVGRDPVLLETIPSEETDVDAAADLVLKDIWSSPRRPSQAEILGLETGRRQEETAQEQQEEGVPREAAAAAAAAAPLAKREGSLMNLGNAPGAGAIYLNKREARRFVATKEEVAQLPDKFEHSQNNVDLMLLCEQLASQEVPFDWHVSKPSTFERIRNYFGSIVNLTRRGLLNTGRDPAAVGGDIFVSFVVGIIMGGIFWNLDFPDTDSIECDSKNAHNLLGGLTVTMNTMAFSNFTNAVTFVLCRQMFNRERNGQYYRASAGYLGKTLEVFVYDYIGPICIGTIVYFMMGLMANAGDYFRFMLILCTTKFASTGFSNFAGASVANLDLVFAVAPLGNVFFFLVAGFAIPLDQIPVWMQWLSYISYLRYGFQGSVWTQIEDSEFLSTCLGIDTRFTYWYNFLSLLAVGLMWRLLGFICFKFLYTTQGLAE